jgi:hypothetical protein
MKPFLSICADVDVLSAPTTYEHSAIPVAKRNVRVAMAHPVQMIVFGISTMCCFSQGISHGTSSAVVREDTQIVIAADSRAVDGNGKRLPDTCKILSAGEWHFSLNGMATTDGMDAPKIINAILMHGGNLAGKVKAVGETLTPLLNKTLLANQKPQVSLLGASIFGYEDRTLKLAFLGFVGRAFPESHICPPECPLTRNRAAIFVPGVDEPKFNWEVPLLTGVHSFVQMEIDRKTKDIGGPIQLMRINAIGEHEWVPKKPDVCKDQP